MFAQKLSAKEKITKTIIDLQQEHPFFARIILSLDIQEDTQGKLPAYGRMGVNAKGGLIYNREFVEGLNYPNLKFCLAHEVAHTFLLHLTRRGLRNKIAWNISADLAVNTILIQNNFQALKGTLTPDDKYSFTFGGKILIDLDKKTAEKIYDELPIPKGNTQSPGQGSEDPTSGAGDGSQFDVHYFDENMTPEEAKNNEQYWKDQIIDAAAIAKQRGKMPGGMETYLKGLLHPKLHWRQILRQFVSNQIPCDFSWSRPSRRSQSIGYYLPYVKREYIDVVAHIDTSGSISDKDLHDFYSEIFGILSSFPNVKITIIECDAAIHQVIVLNNNTKSKVKNIKPKGRGGTSHKPVWEYIKKKIPCCKVLVSLTDLCSDIEKSDKPKYPVLWVVPKDGHDTVAFGKILKVG